MQASAGCVAAIPNVKLRWIGSRYEIQPKKPVLCNQVCNVDFF